MNRSTKNLIEEMAADLEPVQSLRLRNGVILLASAVAITVLLVGLLPGLWQGVWHGEASAFFVTTNGLLLILGCAGASSVLRMATPRVGNAHEGTRWASLMVAVLPIAAVLSLLGHDHPSDAIADPYGLKCLGAAMLSSGLSVAVLVYWLRRGAPVSPSRAGLQLGITATAFGSAAYGLACPLDGVVHLGIWHVAPVLIGALLGRYLLPPLLRW